MELYFLALLILLMALALGSGYPVAFALPGSAIVTIAIAAGAGYLFAGNPDAYFHQGGPSQWLSAGVTNLRGVYWEVERDTLIAIPLFIFMGIMLQRSKIAEDLLMTMAQLFGPIPGGLGISVVFVGALLAATTGILGATVVAMGLISLPAMLRNGYSKPLATGTIAAAGTLGQIIPPSIVLIILADQLSSAVDQAGTTRQLLFKSATGQFSMPSELGVVSTSAGEMFLGAFVPGLVLVGLYMAYVLTLAIIRPSAAPSVPREGAFDLSFVVRVVITLVPPLALIFLVLGSIIGGIATVNQAGAIGAAGALLMAGYRLREGSKSAYVPAIIGLIGLAGITYTLSTHSVNIKSITTELDVYYFRMALFFTGLILVALAWSGWRTYRFNNTLNEVMVDTAKTTSLVFIILMGAAMLTAAFRAFGGEDFVREYLNSLPGGFWSQFVIVMGVIFFLGFFLDFIEIAVVVVPIVSPILLADPGANITAVWLGVMIGLNIQTSFLTPPFGFALFYLRGVAPPEVKTLDIYKGVVPFIVLQLVALTIAGNYPSLVNYLPNRVNLLSETSPPPRNPKLQYCLEKYVAGEFALHGPAITQAIERARSLDMSYLPKPVTARVTRSFDKAMAAPGLLAAAFDAEKVVDARADAFRPLHDQVRNIQKQIRETEADVARAETTVSRLRGDDAQARRAPLEQRIQAWQADIKAAEARIPAEWNERSTAFNKLTQAERDARRAYQQSADQGYEPVRELIEVLAGTQQMIALETDLNAMEQLIMTGETEPVAEALQDLGRSFGQVEGADDIKSALNKARRAIKGKTDQKTKAIAEVNEAKKIFAEQMVWRKPAVEKLLPELTKYELAIRDTIGARQQQRLSEAQALSIAACSAGHRDVSLSF